MIKHLSNKFSNVIWAVYAICLMVVGAIVVSDYHLMSVAGKIADVERAGVESKLIDNELLRQKQILVRDQSQISNWNKTLEAFEGAIDRTFVQDEIADWLWSDFDIQRTIVVGENDKIRIAVLEEDILEPGDGEPMRSVAADLIAHAQQSYLSHRIGTGPRYYYKHNPLDASDPGYKADIRLFDGQLGILVAQAIVPEEVTTPAKEFADILVTFKPLSNSYIDSVGANLGLSDFRLSLEPKVGEAHISDGTRIEARSTKNDTPLYVSWTPFKPSKQIWSESRGALLTLLLIVVVGLVFVAMHFGRALAALQASEKQNRFLALHDSLTGLANRLQFDRVLEEVMEQNAQDRCAILCLDLDRFKAVNDTYGHQAGDVAIKTAADRIAACVGDLGLVARVGGDEFIILLKNKLDKEHVLWVCDAIIESVGEPISFVGGVANISASIGVAWWPDDALTAKTVIRSADEALYRAKGNGRGCAQLASEASDESLTPNKSDRDEMAA